MKWVGLCLLGNFIGYIVGYGLRRAQDWSKLENIFSAVINTVIPAGLFAFLRIYQGADIGDALFIYPVGLSYGLFCSNLYWLTDTHKSPPWMVGLFVFGFFVATVLITAITLSPAFRALLD